MNHKQLAEGLRKTAKELRKQAAEIEKEKAEKCAHALIAANGLQQLRNIILDTGEQS